MAAFKYVLIAMVVHLKNGRRETLRIGKDKLLDLRSWADTFEASTQAGGCNAHCGIMLVSEARMVRQGDNKVMREFQRPLFEVKS